MGKIPRPSRLNGLPSLLDTLVQKTSPDNLVTRESIFNPYDLSGQFS